MQNPISLRAVRPLQTSKYSRQRALFEIAPSSVGGTLCKAPVWAFGRRLHLAGALAAGVVGGNAGAAGAAGAAGLLYLLHHARPQRPHHDLHSRAVAHLPTSTCTVSHLPLRPQMKQLLPCCTKGAHRQISNNSMPLLQRRAQHGVVCLSTAGETWTSCTTHW